MWKIYCKNGTKEVRKARKKYLRHRLGFCAKRLATGISTLIVFISTDI